MRDSIVKDSSIWVYPNVNKAAYGKFDSIVMGTVIKSVIVDGVAMYIVKTIYNGVYNMVKCTTLVKFGGIFNYEEFTHTPTQSETKSGADTVVDESGDSVVVGMINGNTEYGVILGCMAHSARKSSLIPNTYTFAYNGFTINIDDKGIAKLTHSGLPTNSLEGGLSGVAEKPEYDESKASSIVWKEDGSIAITNADDQSILVDKAGKISLLNGKHKIEIDKSNGMIKIEGTDLEITIANSRKETMKKYRLEAEDIAMKGTKIAIGSSGGELLDQISKLIDALGTIVLANGGGATHPIQAAPTWAQVVAIKTTIDSMKGSI